jgi:16S rRNA (cytosine1402-N4)-methyltransferase
MKAGSGRPPEAAHTPVMAEQVLEYLQPRAKGRYLDATLGLGGHTMAVLQQTLGAARILGLDRDGLALEMAASRVCAAWPDAQFFVRHDRYSQFESALQELQWDSLDGVLLDLGFSSFQLDNPERGFSFLLDGPLDMRMDAQGADLTAYEIVNTFSVRQLAKIIGEFGEEPLAGRIARKIEAVRRTGPIASTLELAHIVEQAYPPARRAKARNHPATRTFQALRMYVNDETGELQRFLADIVRYLVPGGRLVVISFHSIEDRIVKHFLRHQAKACHCPPRQPLCVCGHTPSLKILTKKPLMASRDEVLTNSRSRSAKLRAAECIADE